MQKFAIVDNDTVVGVLTAGTFMYFKSPSPLVHYRVMPAPGKGVYLLIKGPISTRTTTTSCTNSEDYLKRGER